MTTKTIGVTEEVYDRLKARKRADESFTDLLDRLLDDATANWEDGFGTLSAAEADELNRVAAESRTALSGGLSERQTQALREMSGRGDPDETP